MTGEAAAAASSVAVWKNCTEEAAVGAVGKSAASDLVSLGANKQTSSDRNICQEHFVKAQFKATCQFQVPRNFLHPYIYIFFVIIIKYVHPHHT